MALQTEGQRAHVALHRPTVWRDMVVLERTSHLTDLEVVEGGAGSTSSKKTNERTRCAAFCISAIVVFAALLRADVFDGDHPKNACLAMLALLSILWATEAIPLYVTSMLVPALTVVLKILPAEDGTLMNAPDAAKEVFAVCFLRLPADPAHCARVRPRVVRLRCLRACCA